MRTALLVLLNLMFAGLVLFYVWAAVKLSRSDRAASLASWLGAVQWLVVWTIGGVAAMAGENLREWVMWFAVAIVLSVGLRIWAIARYWRRAEPVSQPSSEHHQP